MIRISSMTLLRAAALGLTFGLAPHGSVQAEPQRDPKALAVVEAALKTIAPEEGWSKVGGLRFTFSIVKESKDSRIEQDVHYVWDVRSGLCRVQWKEDKGDDHIAVFNVGAKGKQGHAYVMMSTAPAAETAATPATPESPAPSEPPRRTRRARWVEVPGLLARKTLLGAYERFVHDSYWLLMPLKLKDPGVNLAYDGERKIGQQTYDVVKVTFDQARPGLSDAYWAYVNRDTHLIDRCEFLRHEAKPPSDESAAGAEKPATARAPERDLWIWKGWKSLGPVKLATLKSTEDGSLSIELKNVETLTSVAETEFRSPVPARPRPAPKPNNG